MASFDISAAAGHVVMRAETIDGDALVVHLLPHEADQLGAALVRVADRLKARHPGNGLPPPPVYDGPCWACKERGLRDLQCFYCKVLDPWVVDHQKK